MVANLTKLITEMAKSRYYDSPQNSLYQEDFYFYFLFYLFIYFFFFGREWERGATHDFMS